MAFNCPLRVTDRFYTGAPRHHQNFISILKIETHVFISIDMVYRLKKTLLCTIQPLVPVILLSPFLREVVGRCGTQGEQARPHNPISFFCIRISDQTQTHAHAIPFSGGTVGDVESKHTQQACSFISELAEGGARELDIALAPGTV
jgi:hypothetical protein